MKNRSVRFFQMIRAPFLSSIVTPLLIGTLLAYGLSRRFDLVNFVAVIIVGLCFHVATNVYNDIYDTLQGTDAINRNRNAFSGGSGVIVNDPALLTVMFRIARVALLVALMGAVLLYFRIETRFRIYLIILAALSAFFSKYYTAAPVKLAYRGWGEWSVWFAFGPMAVGVAVVSQNVGFQADVLAAMPISGISTLSILLIGQIIDFDADHGAGKWGVAVRCGKRCAGFLYGLVQLILCANIAVLSLVFLRNGWPLLISLVPYALLLPGTVKTVLSGFDDIRRMKNAARQNVLLHLSFSLLWVITLAAVVFTG